MTNYLSSARTRTSMKSCALFVVTAAIAALSTGMLRGSMPNVATGTWTPTGALAGARNGAASVLLPDGSVLVTGGSDGAASVNGVQVYGADGEFSAGAAMNEARADHTAVLLGDGSVLVAGGRSGSSAVASAEILINGAWFAAGALTTPRWGHTATLLTDGRVLIAGGENGITPVATIEIFDPATGQITEVGTLASPRKGHAAARLADGRVIIAGGEDTAGAALNSTEIIDATVGSVSPGPSLTKRRNGLSATTLLDGRVVFIGGNDGTNNLGSADWYNNGVVTAVSMTTPMAARRDHQAFLLPNNNALLIVGGFADTTINGVTTTDPSTTAELFLPWIPAVWQTGAMSAPRTKGTGSVLSTETYGAAAAGEGLAVVAGGDANDSSEAYRFAVIRTDKNDYAPGDVVYVSGSGWQPGESVTFDVRELPAEHVARSFSIDADQQGNITDVQFFTVEPHHLNVRFFVTARGTASQAQVTFTDGNVKFDIAPSGNTATFVETLYAGASDCSGSVRNGFPKTLNNSNGDNVGVGNNESIRIDAAANSVQGNVFSAWSSTDNPPSQFTVIPNTGGRSICISGFQSGTQNYRATYVAATRELTAVKSNSVSGNATFPAGWTWAIDVSNGGNAAATFGPTGIILRDELPNANLTYGLPAVSNEVGITGTILCGISSNNLICSSPSGSATIGAGGSFRVAFTATPSAAATYANPRAGGVCKVDPNNLVVETTEGNNDCSNTVIVGKASQTIAFDPLANRTYGDAPFTLTATGGGSGNAVTFTLGAGSVGCAVTGSTVTILSATGIDEFCIIVASQAGNANYDAATAVTRSFMIAKATPTVSVSWTGGTYNGASWAATASVTGAGSPAAVLTTPATSFTYYSGPAATGTPLPGAPIDAGTFTVRASFPGDSNYNAAFADKTIAIAKATPVVTVTWTGGTYNGSPWPASATVAGVGTPPAVLTTPAPILTYYSGATATGTPLAGAPTNAGTYTVRASFAGDANYDSASDDETITIAKADPLVTATWAGGTYNGNPWPATASVTGVGTPAVALTAPPATLAYYSGATATGAPLGGAPTNSGTYTVRASFAGDDNYNPAHDDETITIAKADPLVTATWTGGTYNGNPWPATASVTGVGAPAAVLTTPAATFAYYSGVTATGTPLGGAPTNAGTYTVRASFAGDGNYNAAQDDETITIAKADPVVTVTWTGGTYNGSPWPATASVTGVGTPAEVLTTPAATFTYYSGATATGTPLGGAPTDAGTYTLRVSYDGDDNYNPAQDDETITVAKAPTTTTVTCAAGPFTYDGNPHTPCSVSVTGAGGLSESPAPEYTNNVNAGTATASYTYAETANYLGSSDSENFTIAKAQSVTDVTCEAGPFTYTGNPHTPCSVSVSGPGGLNETPAPNYADNVNAGTGVASYTFAESANYLGSADSENFTILKASSQTVVTCPTNVTFTGSPHTPCSVAVTGAGGLNQTPTPNYANNVNAGTATASYTYAGDSNHDGSSGTKSFTIDKASSTTVVTFEAGPYVYRGTQFTATAQVTGVAGLNQAVTPVNYTGDCTNVTVLDGCTATATFAGDANHLGSSDSKRITLTKRAASVVVDDKTKLLNAPNPTLTGTLTNFIATDGIAATYSTVATQSSPVGTYAITASLDPAAKLGNYQITNTPGTLAIQFLWDGFLQPINDTAHDDHEASLISKFKLGQTVPAKFDLKDANGVIVTQSGAPLFDRGLVSATCGVATQDEPTATLPADSLPIYTLQGGHYQYNWSTKGLAGGLYRIYAKLADGTTRSVLVCLNK